MAMQRRDFMRAMLAATVAPAAVAQMEAQAAAPTPTKEGPPAPGPVPWMRGLDSAKVDPASTISPEEIGLEEVRFFTQTQMDTLRHLSDILVPPLKGKPGAVAAGAPEFMDFYVGESLPDTKMLYQGGLDWIDSESRQKLGKPFAQTNETEAAGLIKPWLRTWMTDHYPHPVHERFLTVALHDIRFATTNSQAWADTIAGKEEKPWMDLYWSPVQPDISRDYFRPAQHVVTPTKHSSKR